MMLLFGLFHGCSKKTEMNQQANCHCTLEEHLKIISRYNTKKVGGYKPFICVPSDPFTLANQKRVKLRMRNEGICK